MPTPPEHILHLQRGLFSAARRHGVTQPSYAAHRGIHHKSVSHLTCSGPQSREMTLGDLVALLEHVGEGQAAADVLDQLAATAGCHVVADLDLEDGGTVAGPHLVLKETLDVAQALVASDMPAAEQLRELDELLRVLEPYRRQLSRA